MLDGHVEVDGAYFGGHVRPENRKEDRKDRRLSLRRSPRPRTVIAFHERGSKVLPFVGRSEAESVALAAKNVDRRATISADEASHWDALHAGWDTGRIDHSLAYSDHRNRTNTVESYVARLRRMVHDQHHYVSSQYPHQYADHAVWLENNRRHDNGTAARKGAADTMSTPVSRTSAGYWQLAS